MNRIILSCLGGFRVELAPYSYETLLVPYVSEDLDLLAQLFTWYSSNAESQFQADRHGTLGHTMSGLAKVPLKILLVDDDPPMLRLVKKWLESDGFQVLAAESPPMALSLANSHHPDIVITDWEMPSMSGPELSKRIKELDSQPKPLVLCLTSRSSCLELMTAVRWGIDDFVRKPIDKGELLARTRMAAIKAGRIDVSEASALPLVLDAPLSGITPVLPLAAS